MAEIGAKKEPGRKTVDKTVYKNTCWCGFGTGSNAAAVDVKDGRVARIRPLHLDRKYSLDELNPWIIEKNGHTLTSGVTTTIPPLAITYKNRIYSKNRVPYPLIRVDWDPKGERNPQNRGKSPYRRISWDEATTIIADEIRRIRETYGSTAIYAQGDGHGETKVMHASHGCQTRLLDLLPGDYTIQNRQPDSWEGWYWGAKHIWGMDPQGQQAMTSNLLLDTINNTELILAWGCDPETTPWGWGGSMASKISYFWTEIGTKQIYICPDVNYGCAIHADKWIPVLPNTDAALQLAIAYVWIKEDLYDKEYIATHADGFDWFERYVRGGEDGVPKTPKWAEGKCGVPARQIKALARYWAHHVTTITHCNGGGYIRSAFSHEPGRLEVALLAMQAVGAPGRNMFKMMEWNLYGMDRLNPMPYPEYRVDVHGAYTGHHLAGNAVHFIPQTLLPDAIMLPEGEELTWYGHCVTGLPRTDQFNQFKYPADGASRIHMIWTDTPCWSTCWNGGNRYLDALRDPSIEFMLVQHPWMENDTLFADIILPISTTYEEEDITTSSRTGENDILIYQEQAIEPVGEAKSDSEAVLEVAKKLGLADKLMEDWCYPKGVEEDESGNKEYPLGEPSYDTLLKMGFHVSGAEGHTTLDDLKGKGYFPVRFRDNWEDAPVGMSDFYKDPENNPLQTPTGKIEFYATGIADVWGDDGERPPVPHWIEESPLHHERLTNERGKDYPFLVVSNHPHFRVHAQHDDCIWLREIEMCKVKGPDGYLYEPIWINPVDARARDIKTGDIVGMYNERGMVLGGAIVTERIMQHCLSQDHGARVDPIVAGTGGIDRGGANNLICPGATTSKNAPGEVTNGFLANIKKVDVFALAEQYPEAFSRNYDPADGMHASDRIVEEA